MNTTSPDDPINLPVPDGGEPAQTPTLRQTIRDLWRDTIREDKPSDLMVGAGALLALVLTVYLVVQAVEAGVPHAIVMLVHPTQSAIAHYLDTHADAVDVPATTLALAWLTVGGVLWLASSAFAARGAQLGWLLYGAASVAMSYAGAAHPAAWPAAGITGTWWALLSIPALRRPNRPTYFEGVIERRDSSADA